MTGSRDQAATPEELIRTELTSIKDNVAGVHGSVMATSDGLLVTHDVPDLEPSQVAALAATTHALAFRATLATGRGQFCETLTRGTHGYLAVYAIGDGAIVAIIGSPQLNVGMLQYHVREVIERLARHTAHLPVRTAAAPGPKSPEAGAGRPMPRRRTSGRRDLPRCSAQPAKAVQYAVKDIGTLRIRRDLDPRGRPLPGRGGPRRDATQSRAHQLADRFECVIERDPRARGQIPQWQTAIDSAGDRPLITAHNDHGALRITQRYLARRGDTEAVDQLRMLGRPRQHLIRRQPAWTAGPAPPWLGEPYQRRLRGRLERHCQRRDRG